MTSEERKQLRDVPVTIGNRGLALQGFDEALRFANIVAASGIAPKGLDKPEKVFVALATGLEAGLSPMAAIRSVYVVGQMPAWRAEAALALIRNSPACEYIEVGVRGEGDEREGFVRTCRVGDPTGEHTFTFSVKDAKTAKMWGKAGPRGDSAWVTFPEDQMQWRAVMRCAKRLYADVLLSLPIDLEVRDLPPSAVAVQEATPPSEPDPLLGDAKPELEVPTESVAGTPVSGDKPAFFNEGEQPPAEQPPAEQPAPPSGDSKGDDEPKPIDPNADVDLPF